MENKIDIKGTIINEDKCNKKCKYCNCKLKDKGEIIRYGVSKGILDAFLKIVIILIILFICFSVISLVTLFASFNIFFDAIADMINDISNNFTENINDISNSITNNFNESIKSIFPFKK
nr:hypothetical protein [uncultured Tyzzerella sp.]